MRGDIRIVPLYSSSEGNSTLVTVNGHHILIDIGKNCKQCGLALQKVGVYPDDIEAVFLTHSHSDHISGVSVFMKKYSTPVYATAPTLRKIDTQLTGLLHPIEEKSVTVFEDMGIRVESYPTYHDATGSVIYRIYNTKTDMSVCVMTDIGKLTVGLTEFCAGCDGGLFESNYDMGMLIGGPYPHELKMRICKGNGHLSNDECAEAVRRFWHPGLKNIFLCHLSENNNTPALAFEATAEALRSIPAGDGLSAKDITNLQTLPRTTPSQIYSL